jgi:hypothetical protein
MISLIPESHHCTKRQSTMTRPDHQIRRGTMTTQLENQEILIGEVIRRGDWRPNDQILLYYGHPLEQHPSSSQEEKKEEGPSGREQAEQPPPNRPPIQTTQIFDQNRKAKIPNKKERCGRGHV